MLQKPFTSGHRLKLNQVCRWADFGIELFDDDFSSGIKSSSIRFVIVSRKSSFLWD